MVDDWDEDKIPDVWDEPEGWNAKEDARRRGEIQEERRVQLEANRQAATQAELGRMQQQPGNGSFRSSAGLLAGFLLASGVLGLIAYASVSQHSEIVGWLGGAIFSAMALYCFALVLRAMFRLVRTGTTQKLN